MSLPVTTDRPEATIDELDALRRVARPLPEAMTDLLDLAGHARIVLIGEASHGTAEFYRVRAALTRTLIELHGFRAVAAEADWPDAFRVNAYVRGRSDDRTADDALGGFRRFPHWMWRNNVMLEFVDWLRAYDDAQPDEAGRAGFYGLDLYSLNSSMGAVVAYLDRVDPEAARRARERYACFDHFGEDAQAYGYATERGGDEPCEDEVVQQLTELQRHAAELASRDGRSADDDVFDAEQNARLARDAERYYRAMFRGRAASWNLRDRHMVETLEAVIDHLDRRPGPDRGKVVVWAHNSHLGDARATEMGAGGEHNLGQLARERFGEEVYAIGFSTDHGSVTAATDWGEPAARKQVRPGLAGSYERLFHQTGIGEFGLDLRGEAGELGVVAEGRLQRAIGVIYRPETERWSHYLHARLPEQFDALLHLDATTALEPLERTPGWDRGETPETFPFAE